MNVFRGYYYLQTDKYSKKIPFNANKRVLKKELDLLFGGDAKVKRHQLNENGDVDDSLKRNQVKGYQYEIEYQGMRKSIKDVKVYTRFLKARNGDVQAAMRQVTNRGEGKKYRLEVDGQASEEIGMYDDSASIKRKLMKMGYSKDIQVSVTGQSEGDQQVLIEFKNQTKTMEDKNFKVQGDNKDWVAMEREQDASNEQIFMPISEDQVNIRTNTTQISIEVDGQKVPCAQKVCSFEVEDNEEYPKIDDFELNDNGTLVVNLDKNLPTDYDMKNLTLKLGNSKCVLRSVKDKKLECDFGKE